MSTNIKYNILFLVILLPFFSSCNYSSSSSSNRNGGKTTTTANYYVPYLTWGENVIGQSGCGLETLIATWPRFSYYLASKKQDGTCFGTDSMVSYSYQKALSDEKDLVVTARGTIDPLVTRNDWNIYLLKRNQAPLLISKGIGGVESNGRSLYPTVSENGRYICFSSDASNLVVGDTNNRYDIFIYDQTNGTMTRIKGPTEPDGHSSECVISQDGTHALFLSNATNLVTGDTNSLQDAFVYNIATQIIERVSLTDSGSQITGNPSTGHVNKARISSDGRYVVFSTSANNLITSETHNGHEHIYLRDRTLNTTVRISNNTMGDYPNGESTYPDITDDGRYVIYLSTSSDIDPTSTNGIPKIFHFDRQTGVTRLLSKNPDGSQFNGDLMWPTITGDGKYIIVFSNNSNLVSPAINYMQAFFYDISQDKYELISKDSNGLEADNGSIIDI